MKKSFAILLVTVLTSCVTALEPPKSNTDYKKIIGKPIKIGNIEVAQYDFPKQMNWKDAKIFCINLGKGWRLPSQEELIFLYQNKYGIGGFEKYAYWSSTEVDYNHAWDQDFVDGFQYSEFSKNSTYYVRAIRTL